MVVRNRRIFELRLGKLGLALFIGGMSLLLFCVFLTGIIVGKHMDAYPERYASGIPELIRDRWFSVAAKPGAETLPRAEKEKKDEPAGEDASVSLTFYDTLGGKKEGGAAEHQSGALKGKNSEMSAEQIVSAEKVAGPELPGKSPEGTEEKAASQVRSANGEGKKTNSVTAGSPAGESVKKPTADEVTPQEKGRFEIQVAAYQERRQAEQLVKKISGFGFSPRIVMKDLPGKGRWFRVIVGGFESRGTAQDAVEQMTGKVRGLKCVIRSSGKNGHGG